MRFNQEYRDLDLESETECAEKCVCCRITFADGLFPCSLLRYHRLLLSRMAGLFGDSYCHLGSLRVAIPARANSTGGAGLDLPLPHGLIDVCTVAYLL
jgi:hypothetical protein